MAATEAEIESDDATEPPFGAARPELQDNSAWHILHSTILYALNQTLLGVAFHE